MCVCACSVAQSCPALCHSMDCSPSGSSVHENFQAAILERSAISYFRESSWPRDQTRVFWVSRIGFFCLCATWEAHKFVVQSLSYVWLFVTLRTTAHQAPLSSTISKSFLRFMAIESVMLSNHLVLCSPPPPCLFLLSSIFPSIRVRIGKELTYEKRPWCWERLKLEQCFSNEGPKLIGGLQNWLSQNGYFSNEIKWNRID